MGQEGPLEGANAGLRQKERNEFNFLAEISINMALSFFCFIAKQLENSPAFRRNM